MGNKKKSLKWKLYGEYFCFRKVGLKRLKKTAEAIGRAENKVSDSETFPTDWKHCFFTGHL